MTTRLVDARAGSGREMTMLRLDLDGGEQRTFVVFHQPADVRDMTFMVESVPRQAGSVDYARRVAWIDREYFLPLKEEYADGEGHWTVTARTMQDVERDHRTQVRFDPVDYDVGVQEGLFTERSLRRPPAPWVD